MGCMCSTYGTKNKLGKFQQCITLLTRLLCYLSCVLNSRMIPRPDLQNQFFPKFAIKISYAVFYVYGSVHR